MRRPPATLARILRDAVVDASPRARRVLVLIGALWLLLIALQIWDVRDRSGPDVAAELLGTLTVLLGVMLLVPSWALQTEADRDAARRTIVAVAGAVVAAGAAFWWSSSSLVHFLAGLVCIGVMTIARVTSPVPLPTLALAGWFPSVAPLLLQQVARDRGRGAPGR